MADPVPVWVAGLGCRRGCPHADLRSLLDCGLAQAGLTAGHLGAVATLDRKQGEPGLRALADDLGVQLTGWPAADLRRFDARLTTRSERTFARYGCYGIAEAAALATAAWDGEGFRAVAELALARIDNSGATLALARRAPRLR